MEQVLISALKTEKAVLQLETNNVVSFVVSTKATKVDVKQAVESQFKVKVDDVKTHISMKGKKIARVTLSKGSKAEDIMSALKIA